MNTESQKGCQALRVTGPSPTGIGRKGKNVIAKFHVSLNHGERMARTQQVIGGTWHCHLVRQARKAGRCQYWLGEPGRCPEQINPGDQYIEGEMDPFVAGGFGRERYCMKHLNGGVVDTWSEPVKC